MTNKEQETIPQKFISYVKRLMEVNEGYSFDDTKGELDNHRLAAYGRIDMELEAGRVSPEEAQEQKKVWDERHSYR